MEGGFVEHSNDPAWKAQLRYGKLETSLKHFTVIAEGVVGTLAEGFVCRPGKAFMGMKVWSSSADESGHMAQVIGRQTGFRVDGAIQVFTTEPTQPPPANEVPRGYDITFTPFDE